MPRYIGKIVSCHKRNENTIVSFLHYIIILFITLLQPSIFVRLQLLRLVLWLWFATPYIGDRLRLNFLPLCLETFVWENIRSLSSAIQQYHQQFPKDKVNKIRWMK